MIDMVMICLVVVVEVMMVEVMMMEVVTSLMLLVCWWGIGGRQRLWVGESHVDDDGKEIGGGGIVRLKGWNYLDSLCINEMD
jgi:hypothetical protein